MTPVTRHDIALLIFIVIIAILPCGLLVLLNSQVAYYPVTGEPVKDVLDAQGIILVSEQDNPWNLPGATGGKTYVIIDRDKQQTIISTQNFNSEESRDAAIRSWYAGGTGRGKPAGSLFVIGQHLIIVSPSDRPVLETLGAILNGNR